MNLDELAIKRRSMRKYTEGEVSLAEVKEMIRCAQTAPSWKNSQTGRYYVAISPAMREKVRQCLSEYNRNNTEGAGAYVVATFVKNRSGFDKDGTPTNECGNEWGAYDLGLQNMLLLLKASELGLDTLIMGMRDAEGLRRLFKIGQAEEVLSVIAVGKGGQRAEMPKRREMEEILKVDGEE